MPSRNEILLYLGSDTIVSVGKDNPAYDNTGVTPVAIDTTTYPAATCTGVLKDKDGTQLGASLTFAYVAGTTARWDATVADDHADLVLNMRGTIEVTLTAATGKKMFAELNFLVVEYQGEA